MPKPHNPHRVGHTGLMSADPAHAPGKQHIDLDPTRSTARGNPKQYGRTMPVTKAAGRTQRMQRGH